MSATWNEDWKKRTNEIARRNNADVIFNKLRELQNNPNRYITRWIWELLQNALDAVGKFQLVVSVESSRDSVCFSHNGRGFTKDEIAHIIMHGSTKTEDENAIGQFGSGFLTAHLLSQRIEISGRLEDDQEKRFSFSLKRTTDSRDGLMSQIEKAGAQFLESIEQQIDRSGFTTCFRFPDANHDQEVVQNGISDLIKCVPFVLLFNEQISQIKIGSPNDKREFRSEITENENSDAHVTTKKIIEQHNGESNETEYALVQGKLGSIAAPLGDGDVDLDGVPKVFLSLPLVGTKNFGFPAIINSSEILPLENRDGLDLGTSTTASVLKNQKVLEESRDLLVDLISFVVDRNPKYRTYKLLAIGQMPGEPEWSKRYQNGLIERIHGTCCLISEDGTAMSPKEAVIPIANNEQEVGALWTLLHEVKDFRNKLPRRDHAFGWYQSVTSWATIADGQIGIDVDGPEKVDGRRLASWVEDGANVDGNDFGKLSNLEPLLSTQDAVGWLGRVLQFLVSSGLFVDEVRKRAIILNQDKQLCRIDKLRRDNDIGEELKEIADHVLEIHIRRTLRDVRLTAVEGEAGMEDFTNLDLVNLIVKRLRIRNMREIDEVFSAASVRLFAWMVGDGRIGLRTFPAFSQDGGFLSLGTRDTNDNEIPEIPLAPALAWPEELREYVDLFPPDRTLADAYYRAVPSDAWTSLAESRVVRTNPLVICTRVLTSLLTDPPLPNEVKHEAPEDLEVHDVVYLREVMDRLKGNGERARTFWQFLLKWLIHKSPGDLIPTEVGCECGDKHKYYRAAWLVPIVREFWVPLEGQRHGRVTAESLKSLFGDIPEIESSDVVDNFMAAVGISRLDLMRVAIQDDKVPKIWKLIRSNVLDRLQPIVDAADCNPDVLDKLPAIVTAAGGDAAVLGRVPEIVAEARRNPKVADKVLDKVSLILTPSRDGLAALERVVDNPDDAHRVLKQVQEDGVSRIVLDDRRQHVEICDWVTELVTEALGDDFSVAKNGTGRWRVDRFGDVADLSLNGDTKNVAVKIKAVRDGIPHRLWLPSVVRMTLKQARELVKNSFLLCVVPVNESDVKKQDLESRIRFVPNMKPLVDLLRDLERNVDTENEKIVKENTGIKLVIEPRMVLFEVARTTVSNSGFGLDELRKRLLEG